MMAIIEKIYSTFDQNIFIASAGLLLFGFLISRLIKRVRLPRVTGYIIAGIILGPSLLKIFSDKTLMQLEFIPQMALGIIALIIGSGLSFDLIKRLKFRLVIILMFESLGAFFLVMFLLLAFKMPLGAVLPLAAISAATAPAATVAVMKEYRARGPLTETALAIIALDDAVAIILFGLVLTLNVEHLGALGSSILHSLSLSFLEVFLAMIIGVALGWLANFLIRICKEITDSLIIVLGIVLLGLGLASISGVSALLTNMFLGLTLVNISSKNSEIVTELERLTPPIYVFFFVLAGAHLNLRIFTSVGMVIVVWSIVFVLARILGKMSGAYLAGLISRAPQVIRKYLGLTLAPQAGVAIGLSLLITSASGYYEFKSIILNVTLIGVAFNEIIGPSLTRYALFKAKEATEEEGAIA